MQESSKGFFSVPSSSSSATGGREIQDIPSAFQFVGKEGKLSRPHSGSNRTEKRDSGYATDNSPGYFHDFGNNHLQFTFDTEQMDHSRRNSDGNPDDKIDEEVEMVLSHQRSVNSMSGPIAIPPGTLQRPSAPVPRSGTDEIHKTESLPTFHSYPRQEVCHRHRYRGHYFRPIESRSVGTQTPSPHSQIINDAINDRFHPYLPNAARAHARLRHFSEGEDTNNQPVRSPLPDIIPTHRDRSVSLPNVPSLQLQNEVEVGRELRRISDEFHSSYTPSRRRGSVINGHQPSSFPGTSTFNFQNWWENLRQIFTSQNDIRNASFHGSSDDLDVFEIEH